MDTEKTTSRTEKVKSNAFGSGVMGHGISEMMTKCCSGQGRFPDCLAMMEEMKRQHCAPKKDEAEAERKKK